VGYRLLADAVVGVHCLFIVFVVTGGFIAWRWPKVAWAHVPAALWGALIELAGWICPLTPLENSLRRAAGESGYAGGFIEHYVIPVIYPAGLTRGIQLGLAILVVAINVVAYVGVRRRRLGVGREPFR
jgi:hypothetical protein